MVKRIIKRNTAYRRRAYGKSARAGGSLKRDRSRLAKRTTRSIKKWRPRRNDLMVPVGRARKGVRRRYRRLD